MICPYCGAENNDENVICIDCCEVLGTGGRNTNQSTVNTNIHSSNKASNNINHINDVLGGIKGNGANNSLSITDCITCIGGLFFFAILIAAGL